MSENGKYHKYRYNVIEILFHSPATLCLSEIYEYGLRLLFGQFAL